MAKERHIASADMESAEISLTTLELAATETAEDGEPLEGERFGKYTLVGELGLGGMAEVFLAVHYGLEDFHKVVTLKRVLPHLTASPDFIRMFVDEARLAARIEHPNVVRTHELGEHEGQYYTVMEYLAGEDLGSTMNRAAISRQPISCAVAAHIVAKMCDGLHFAHELTDMAGRPLGLVHRDVNPSNVIITYGGEVKVIDFGVAKAATNTIRTIAGTIKGKVAYMAPEQVLSRGVDRRSDIFSLGVVLWELVVGHPLFARDSDHATLYALMNDPIPRPSRYRADVPPELEAIIGTALSRTPADRFDNAEEMQSALGAFLAKQPAVDSRTLARLVESLFGSTRADAKRSISQVRALAKNVSLVMKLRREVRTSGLARASTQSPLVTAPKQRRLRVLAVTMLTASIVAGVAGVAALAVRQRSAHHEVAPGVARATLELTSTPPGAAVLVNGEPTGLVTPATLANLSPGELAIRIELAGHLSAARVFDLHAGRTAHAFELVQEWGRLALANLPLGAVILIAGEEHPAGEVLTIPVGRHEIRIVVDGATIVQQEIETAAGHQVWELRDHELVRK